MANEISVQYGLQVAKGNLSMATPQSSTRVSMTGTRGTRPLQTIGTGAHEALTFGDLASAGFITIRNLDATNDVRIGLDVGGTFYPFAVLKANDPPATFRMYALTLYAIAITGACDIEFLALEA